jgi:tetratricopeptide (TPR) repeat protein
MFKIIQSPRFLFFLLLFLISGLSKTWGQEEALLKELEAFIEKAPQYDAQKWQKIGSFRRQLDSAPQEDLRLRHHLNQELLNEYRVFKQDSAFYYGLRTRELAEKLQDKELIAAAVINLADISVSAGMYKEALEYLSLIEPEGLPENLRSLYYGLMGRCYSEMAEYSNLKQFSEKYNRLAREYREKALALTDEGTFFNDFLQSYIQFKEGNLERARNDFLKLLGRELNSRELALTSFILGEIYVEMGEKQKAIPHLAVAAMADIETSAKENLAVIRLSEIMFEKGNTRLASVYIHKANEDASFYGAQQRKIRVGAILPLIEEQIIDRIERQRSRLLTQNVVMGFLLIFVIALAVVILFQVRKLKRARKVIEEAHENLKIINRELTAVNEKINLNNLELNRVNHLLLEANKIKEEYIGFFFTQDADIFEKFRDFKSRVEVTAEEGKLDKVKYLLSTYDLKKEKEKLLRNFDEAFIKLFPNFIEEFNSLLRPEEQIHIKKGKILNKELRIFALIRLGITHNEIIAQILGYSVNSIYAYKTKLRNKSWLDKKDFDQKLFENTTLKL